MKNIANNSKVMNTIAFRVDASPVLATGHFMRCLTLAIGLKKLFTDANIIFICNLLPENLISQLTQNSIKLINLPFDIDSSSWQQNDDAQATISAIEKSNLDTIDLLIVDHYQIDYQWQKQLQPYFTQLLVIDDLANRHHCADFLLDQTLNRQPNDYSGLLEPKCQLLLGQTFMLLRDEFKELISQAKKKRQQTKKIQNILINLGGMDNDNVTSYVISAMIDYHKKNPSEFLNVEVIMGSQSKHLLAVQSLISTLHWIELTIDCHDMAHKILNADLAIGACGTTAWERCSLGLPTLGIILADNQQWVNISLAEQSAIIDLGNYKTLTSTAIINAIKHIKAQPQIYQTMVKNSFNCCDGLGLERLLTRLTGPNVTLIKASIDDLDLTFQWQSDKKVRRFSRNPKPVVFEEHQQWFSQSLANKNRHIFMVCCAGEKVGVLRLDKLKKLSDAKSIEQFEVSILIAPQAQGNKLALKALHAIPSEFNQYEIFAYVQTENHASHKLFNQANYLKLNNNSYLRPAYIEIECHEKN